MAQSSWDADVLSSPSFHDNEAASQQLLAEASSPVRRPTAAPISASAVRGATLLNHARTLTKPPAVASSEAKGNAGKLPKLGQLNPVQLKPVRLQKPGKLVRASLSSLVSEPPLKMVRGDKMYEIGPSPQKRNRPRSMPSQAAALEDEDVVAGEEDDVVPETSQAQPEVGSPAASSNNQHPLAGNDQVEKVAALPVALPQEPIVGARKQRGRPRKSGESAASAPLLETRAGKDQEAAVDTRSEDYDAFQHLPSSPPELPPREVEPAATKKRRGRPRKSGGSTTSTRVSDVEQPPRQERTASPVLSPKLKRKARPDEPPKIVPYAEFGGKAPPARKQRRLMGPVMISPDMPAFEEDLLAPQLTSRYESQPRSDAQSDVRIPIRSTRSHTARVEAETASTQEHSATAIITVAHGRKPEPTSRLTRSKRSANAASVPESSIQEPSASNGRSQRGAARYGKRVEDSVEQATNEPTVDHEQLDGDQDDGEGNMEVRDGEHHAECDEEDERHEVHNAQHRPQHDNEDADPQEEDQNANTHTETANPMNAERINDGNINRLSTLNKVFEFAVSEERSGICSTKLGRSIHRRCDRSRVVLSRADEDCSLEDIAKCKDDLVDLLLSIHVKVQEARRSAFKRDAFAYLFRNLTVVLEAMHDKLQEKRGDITGSLESMQIVYPFIRQLLRFKDTMDSWKVVVQQRTVGDRLIKGVESDLIAPLRAIEKDFRRHLRRLQNIENTRRVAAEIQRQREEKEEEDIRKEELLRSTIERRKRWQELHITRMQCEPDPSRRRRLRLIEPIQAAETDANGQPFERVPFFGERSAPPPQWTVASSGKEWTEEQEIALLDALQLSANLERIFTSHCGPSGILRELSVSDIAAKLAWVRSGWAQLSHQHGWEVPEWVKNIPVLP